VENLPPQPQPLDYFAPHEPQRQRARGVVTWSMVLLLSWAPYLCGVVNASTVARSYVPDITRSAFNATVIGFVIGLTLSAASFLWFARQRHLAGAIAAAGVFGIQLSVAVCLGIAT
jgi:hypothetical protein